MKRKNVKLSKKRKAAFDKVDHEKMYAPAEALGLAKDVATAKFDETVEVHVHMGVDPTKADQQIRGTVVLPHGTGKTAKVIVFAQGEKVKEAEEAGADEVGGDELVEKVQKGWLDFEAAVATPDLMAKVGKLGKVLGPRGLMPNPKTGTVTFDVGKAVSDIKGGKVEYRLDKFAIMHLIIGKVSFEKDQLIANYSALFSEIIREKPASTKGKYIKSISVSTTMGPGIKVDPVKTSSLVGEEE